VVFPARKSSAVRKPCQCSTCAATTAVARPFRRS